MHDLLSRESPELASAPQAPGESMQKGICLSWTTLATSPVCFAGTLAAKGGLDCIKEEEENSVQTELGSRSMTRLFPKIDLGKASYEFVP